MRNQRRIGTAHERNAVVLTCWLRSVVWDSCNGDDVTIRVPVRSGVAKNKYGQQRTRTMTNTDENVHGQQRQTLTKTRRRVTFEEVRGLVPYYYLFY